MSRSSASAAALVAPAAEAPKPRPPVLESKRFSELEHAWGFTWAASIPDDVPYDDILKPGYWKLIARRLRLRNKIEAMNDGQTWFACLLVTSINPIANYVDVRELYRRELAPPLIDGTEVNGFDITWGGGFEKWIVSRTVDGHLMKGGFETRDAARYFVTAELTPRLVGR